MAKIVPEGEGRWSLVGEANIHHAQELHQALVELAASTSDTPLVLDMARLDDLDTAGMQLLLSFARSRGERACQFVGCPRPLRDLLRSMDLEKSFFGGT